MDLPDDIVWYIYKKLHKLYMKDLNDELIEFVEDWEWRKNNNLGDDFNDWD